MLGKPPPPPGYHSHMTTGGWLKNPTKIAQKTVRQELVRATQYTPDLICYVRCKHSINRGSQRRIWTRLTNRPTNQDQRTEQGEGGGDGARGSHQGSSKIGVSKRQLLMRMQAYINM